MNGTFNQNKPGRFSNNGKVFHGTSFQLLLFVTGPRFCDSLEACLDRDGTYIYIICISAISQSGSRTEPAKITKFQQRSNRNLHPVSAPACPPPSRQTTMRLIRDQQNRLYTEHLDVGRVDVGGGRRGLGILELERDCLFLFNKY